MKQSCKDLPSFLSFLINTPILEALNLQISELPLWWQRWSIYRPFKTVASILGPYWAFTVCSGSSRCDPHHHWSDPHQNVMNAPRMQWYCDLLVWLWVVDAPRVKSDEGRIKVLTSAICLISPIFLQDKNESTAVPILRIIIIIYVI